MEMSGQFHAPGALLRGKEPRYQLDWRLGGAQSRPERGGQEKKIPSPPLLGIEPQSSSP
jgi:hypothetical protein